MCGIKMMPCLMIVPISFLITLSFFVLFALRKVEEKPLRALGYVAAGLLWLAVLVVVLAGSYKMGKQEGFRKCKMQHEMSMPGMTRCEMPKMEREQGMPETRNSMPKLEKAKSGSVCGNRGMIYKKGAVNE